MPEAKENRPEGNGAVHKEASGSGFVSTNFTSDSSLLPEDLDRVQLWDSSGCTNLTELSDITLAEHRSWEIFGDADAGIGPAQYRYELDGRQIDPVSVFHAMKLREQQQQEQEARRLQQQVSAPAGDREFAPTPDMDLLHRAAEKYLTEISDRPEVGLRQIYGELFETIHAFFTLENARRKQAKDAGKGSWPTLTLPKDLPESIMVKVLLARFHIRAINLAAEDDAETALLGIYCDDPSDDRFGLYITKESAIRKLGYQLKTTMTSKAAESLLKTLKDHAPVVFRTGQAIEGKHASDAHLIPVANGIFDHQQQILLPFSPEHVFLRKSPVRYVANAQNPVIPQPDGEPWDVESWIASLSDDEGVEDLLWELLSALMRPGVRWDKAAFLHSTKGNNGKGTFCQLGRNLVGADGHTSIAISKFDGQFALTKLITAQAVITDENPVGAFTKDLSTFKEVITGDVTTMERKYKDPLSIRFQGMTWQCVNDFPKSRDKSASYTRRQLFIPFRKWFGADGVERKWIKHDYISRPEVLEYVLAKALHMTHTELSNPPACQALLAEFQRENDSVLEFWEDHKEEFQWDLLPKTFLYELFIAWLRKTNPGAETPPKLRMFWQRLREILEDSPDWHVPVRPNDPSKVSAVRPAGRMAAAEPLVLYYDLKDWQNGAYSGNDPSRKALPAPLAPNYEGVLRGAAAASAAAPATPTDQITAET